MYKYPRSPQAIEKLWVFTEDHSLSREFESSKSRKVRRQVSLAELNPERIGLMVKTSHYPGHGNTGGVSPFKTDMSGFLGKQIL